MVFFSGENGGYIRCGLIQWRVLDCLLMWRVWMVCSSGEYGRSATVRIMSAAAEVGLLQWKLWMSVLVEIMDVCFSGNYGCLF